MKNFWYQVRCYLSPYKDNTQAPGVFTALSIASLFLVILLVFSISLLGTEYLKNNKGFLAEVLPAVLVSLANEDRGSYQVSSLKTNPLLERAAQMKANDMASKGYFAHTSPEGVTPWYWFEAVGYDYKHAGENLAVNFSESKDVNQGWMNSPGHRENILNPNYTEVGIATAIGYYKGQETVFVVQLFGTPRQPAPAPTVATKAYEDPKPDVLSEKDPAIIVPGTVAGAETNTVVNKSPNSQARQVENIPTDPLQAAEITAVGGAVSKNSEVQGTVANVADETSQGTEFVDDSSFAGGEQALSPGGELLVVSPGQRTTSWQRWFFANETLPLRIAYSVITVLIFAGLCTMIIRGFYKDLPLNILLGIGLVLLMILLMYWLQLDADATCGNWFCGLFPE